jgi:hypothetical protein
MEENLKEFGKWMNVRTHKNLDKFKPSKRHTSSMFLFFYRGLPTDLFIK